MFGAASPGTIITVALLFAIPLAVMIAGFLLVLPYIAAHKERYPTAPGEDRDDLRKDPGKQGR